MTVDNLTLFDVAPLVTPAVVGLTIDERFAAFHAANPWVYRALVGLARDYRRRQPGRRVGIAMCFEVLRWTYDRQTDGDPFKLNNTYRSRYARLIAANEPDLADAFETRELRSA